MFHIEIKGNIIKNKKVKGETNKHLNTDMQILNSTVEAKMKQNCLQMELSAWKTVNVRQEKTENSHRKRCAARGKIRRQK